MDGKGIGSGTQFRAMHGYKKNPDNPEGNEVDLNEGDTSLLDEERRKQTLVAGCSELDCIVAIWIE